MKLKCELRFKDYQAPNDVLRSVIRAAGHNKIVLWTLSMRRRV
jgi:hypothetical protein